MPSRAERKAGEGPGAPPGSGCSSHRVAARETAGREDGRRRIPGGCVGDLSWSSTDCGIHLNRRLPVLMLVHPWCSASQAVSVASTGRRVNARQTGCADSRGSGIVTSCPFLSAFFRVSYSRERGTCSSLQGTYRPDCTTLESFSVPDLPLVLRQHQAML